MKFQAGYTISLLLSFLLAGRGDYHTSVSGDFEDFQRWHLESTGHEVSVYE